MSVCLQSSKFHVFASGVTLVACFISVKAVELETVLLPLLAAILVVYCSLLRQSSLTTFGKERESFKEELIGR